MNRNVIVGGVVLVVLALVGYLIISPAFVTNEVDEAFPGLEDAERDVVREMPEEQQAVLVEMASEDEDMAAETALAMMEDDTEMAEDMPAEEPEVLASGTFNTYDPVHSGEGTATVYELPDGSRVLRLEDFSVTNGPELHVLLSPTVPTNIRERPGEGYVDLGILKGNVGNQNYEIPDDVELGDKIAVIIYCMPFHVNFTTAEFEA